MSFVPLVAPNEQWKIITVFKQVSLTHLPVLSSHHLTDSLTNETVAQMKQLSLAQIKQRFESGTEQPCFHYSGNQPMNSLFIVVSAQDCVRRKYFNFKKITHFTFKGDKAEGRCDGLGPENPLHDSHEHLQSLCYSQQMPQIETIRKERQK